EFCSNALLEFDDGSITVRPPARGSQQTVERASVNTEVRSNSDNYYSETYTMDTTERHRYVRNGISEGINNDLLFCDDFARAMQTHRNNLDAVIENWGSVVAESREAVEKEVNE